MERELAARGAMPAGVDIGYGTEGLGEGWRAGVGEVEDRSGEPRARGGEARPGDERDEDREAGVGQRQGADHRGQAAEDVFLVVEAGRPRLVEVERLARLERNR